MANSKEYSGMARSRMDCLRQNLSSKGITPRGDDSGTIEYMGVKLSVDYDESRQALKVEVLEKPEFIPDSLIWSFIDGAVKQCP